MTISITFTAESVSALYSQMQAILGGVGRSTEPAAPRPVEGVVTAAPTATEKRSPGRPRKAAAPVDAPPAPEAPAEAIGDEQAEPAPETPAAPLAPTAPASEAAPVGIEDLRKTLVQLIQTGESGRNTVAALCLKYGSKNLSTVDAKHYPDLNRDALAELAKVKGG